MRMKSIFPEIEMPPLFSKFTRRCEKQAVIIPESEFCEFLKLGEAAGKKEIAGALIGLNYSGNYLIHSILKYRSNSTPVSVTYNQLENSFLPAGLENLGTIHTHPGFGAFLSGEDLSNLKNKNLNRIAVILDPETLDVKAFNKEGDQIKFRVVEDHEVLKKIRVLSFYRYGIPFRVYVPDEVDEIWRAVIKYHIDTRYSDSQLLGIYHLKENNSYIYYEKPRIILLKYRNKVPLYFSIKNRSTYNEWFNNAVMNGVIEFEFTKFTVRRNGEAITLEYVFEEVVKDGITEFHMF